MVKLEPIATPTLTSTNIISSSDQSSPSSPSPTSPLPILPSSHHFHEPMFSSHFYFPFTFFYYYFYPFYFYPFTHHIYPQQPTSFSVPPPPSPPPCDGVDVPVAQPPSSTTRVLQNNRRTFEKKKKMITTIWKPKHASGSHYSSPSSSTHLANCTTLMVKNLPNSLSRRSLINMLDYHCWQQNRDSNPTCSSHQYDFVYLPFDFHFQRNLGYAFVNFTTVEGALRLHSCWSGKGWRNTPKIREITRARLQGLEKCKKYFQTSIFHCQSEEYLPVELSPPRNGYNSRDCKMTTIGKWVDVNKGAIITSNAKSRRPEIVIPPRLSH